MPVNRHPQIVSPDHGRGHRSQETIATSSSELLPELTRLWQITRGDPRICVAVLDGPVDRTHASLRHADLTEIPTPAGAQPQSDAATRHGTYIASLIFGQHGRSPVRGIAPGCRGLIIPIFGPALGDRIRPCSQIDLARCITSAALAGAHIINISAGQFSPSGAAHPLLEQSVRRCADLGVLIISAAGNEGCDCVHLPAALGTVIAVGAVDRHGRPMQASNWGMGYVGHSLVGPGDQIPGAIPGGGVAAYSGTSAASAIVCGAAALLLSAQLKQGIRPSPLAVGAALIEGAITCEERPASDCRRILGGRLHLTRTVTRLMPGGSPMIDRFDEAVSTTGDAAHDAAAAQDPLPMPDSALRPSDGVASLTPPSVYEPRTHDASDRRSPAPSHGTMSDAALVPPRVMARAGRNPSAAPTGLQPSASGVLPSACACGGSAHALPQLVFALGRLDYDLGSESRRESLASHMRQGGIKGNPEDPEQLLEYLDKNPWEAQSIVWTLSVNDTPVYAVEPAGAYAIHVHDLLLQFLREQIRDGAERISVPGVIAGSVPLLRLAGATVPVIRPNPRGMYNWTTNALIESVAGKSPAKDADEKKRGDHGRRVSGVQAVLDRVYHDNHFMNLGIEGTDRALNYAITNAFMVDKAIESALKDEMELDSIGVERSSICRPDSECYDVQLFFYDPRKQLERARRVFQFAVDVSDEVPVMVGPMRSWSVR